MINARDTLVVPRVGDNSVRTWTRDDTSRVEVMCEGSFIHGRLPMTGIDVV